ncbi:hypothetical protein BS630_14590 [Rhizobium laguerreae]|nr:hypothetical protein BS630_14590 [Rhizobium laguerreae]
MPPYPHFGFCRSVSIGAVDDGEEIYFLKAGPQPIHSDAKNCRSGRIWNHFQIRLLPEIQTKSANPSDVLLQARDKWHRRWMDFNP